MRDYVIVGSGITGLALAYRLSRSGKNVLVLESGAVPGGVVRTELLDGCLLEHGPNSALSNEELCSLIAQLQIDDQVLEPAPFAKKRFLAVPDRESPGGLRLAAAPSGIISAVRTPILSLKGKARMFGEVFSPRCEKEDEPVFDFCSRRFGSEAAEKLFGAMLSGIWASDIKSLSARSALPLLWEMERESGSVIRTALGRAFMKRGGKKHKRRLVSFRSGMDFLTRALSAALLPDEIRLSAKVSSIQRHGDSWTLIFEHEGRREEAACRGLVLALPAKDTAELLQGHAPELAGRVATIPYAPLGVIHVSFDKASVRHPLDGFGFLVAPSYGKAILGAIFSSSLFSGRAPDGRHLLTCFVGGASKPQYADVSDPAVLERAVGELMQLVGASEKPQILKCTYWKEAIPNYPIGHYRLEEALSAFEARNPGLHLLGNWRKGISVADRIKQASLLADTLTA